MTDEKKCARCGETKSISEFSKNKSRKDGLNPYCKTCVSEIYPAYKKAYHERHPEAYNEYYHKYRDKCLSTRKKYCEERLQLLWELKTPCVKCGETRKCSIDFHHISPSEKDVNLSDGGVGKARIKEEAKKCVCLCANCHKEFHYLYGHHPNNPEGALEEYLKGEIENDHFT